MSDGRLFTDYRSRCGINFPTSTGLNNYDSYSYRQHLMHNGEAFLDAWRGAAYTAAQCGPCAEPFVSGTMLPERLRESCDAARCQRVEVNPNGIGLGRAYSSVAKRDPEVERRAQERQQTANCCGHPSDYDGYYPPTGVDAGLNRNASVGGGAPLSGGDMITF
jgi:hypothetical protein